MGGWRRSRPSPSFETALRASSGRGSLTEGLQSPPQGRIHCKQQRIYSPFTSIAARPSPNEKSRCATVHVLGSMWLAFICDAMAREMSPSCNGPALWGAGRNTDCGFSPIPFRRGRQKNGCQDSRLDWTEKNRIGLKNPMGDLFASISSFECTGLPACAGNCLDGCQHAARRLRPAPFGTQPTR